MSISSVSSNLSDQPDELLVCQLSYLRVTEFISLCFVSRRFKEFINNSPALQPRIIHQYLHKRHHLANIPIDDLKYDLRDNRLAIQIKNDLSVYHLVNDLSLALPWTNSLIINACKAASLKNLLNVLVKSKSLTTLILKNCELDTDCISILRQLQIPKDTRMAPPLFFYNVSVSTDEDMASYSVLLEKVNSIKPEDANKYSIEKLDGEETDIASLEKFESLVVNAEDSSETVLEAFDLIRDVIRSGIINSIWHGAILKPHEDPTETPMEMIHAKVRTFISECPHHPAVLTAARSKRSEFIDYISS